MDALRLRERAIAIGSDPIADIGVSAGAFAAPGAGNARPALPVEAVPLPVAAPGIRASGGHGVRAMEMPGADPVFDSLLAAPSG